MGPGQSLGGSSGVEPRESFKDSDVSGIGKRPKITNFYSPLLDFASFFDTGDKLWIFKTLDMCQTIPK